MSEIRFEDEVIKVEEDIETLDVAYDIQDNKLIAVKTLKQTLCSQIYNYDDGISVYLKFEDTGKFFNVMFAIYKANGEKKIISVPRHVDLALRRIDKSHFHILTRDDVNNETNITAVTIKNDTEVAITQFNFTDVVEYRIIDDKFVLINAYDDLNDGHYLYTMGVYNLAGKTMKIMLDEQVDTPSGYEFVIQKLPDSGRRLLAINVNNGVPKVLSKILMPVGYSKNELDMIEANKQTIIASGTTQFKQEFKEDLGSDVVAEPIEDVPDNDELDIPEPTSSDNNNQPDAYVTPEMTVQPIEEPEDIQPEETTPVEEVQLPVVESEPCEEVENSESESVGVIVEIEPEPVEEPAPEEPISEGETELQEEVDPEFERKRAEIAAILGEPSKAELAAMRKQEAKRKKLQEKEEQKQRKADEKEAKLQAKLAKKNKNSSNPGASDDNPAKVGEEV